MAKAKEFDAQGHPTSDAWNSLRSLATELGVAWQNEDLYLALKRRVGAALRKNRRKDWIDRLSPQAKAEILGSVLHALECAYGRNRKAYMKLPRVWRKQVEAAMRDCSVMHDSLSGKDLQDIREWFVKQKKKRTAK